MIRSQVSASGRPFPKELNAFLAAVKVRYPHLSSNLWVTHEFLRRRGHTFKSSAPFGIPVDGFSAVFMRSRGKPDVEVEELLSSEGSQATTTQRDDDKLLNVVLYNAAETTLHTVDGAIQPRDGDCPNETARAPCTTAVTVELDTPPGSSAASSRTTSSLVTMTLQQSMHTLGADWTRDELQWLSESGVLTHLWCTASCNRPTPCLQFTLQQQEGPPHSDSATTRLKGTVWRLPPPGSTHDRPTQSAAAAEAAKKLCAVAIRLVWLASPVADAPVLFSLPHSRGGLQWWNLLHLPVSATRNAEGRRYAWSTAVCLRRHLLEMLVSHCHVLGSDTPSSAQRPSTWDPLASIVAVVSHASALQRLRACASDEVRRHCCHRWVTVDVLRSCQLRPCSRELRLHDNSQSNSDTAAASCDPIPAVLFVENKALYLYNLALTDLPDEQDVSIAAHRLIAAYSNEFVAQRHAQHRTPWDLPEEEDAMRRLELKSLHASR